jgi:hypothetical protein
MTVIDMGAVDGFEASSVRKLHAPAMVEDLAKSGLEVADVRAKPLTAAEKAATGTASGLEGYVLPYFDLAGKPLPFYRVRLFNAPGDVKYRQLADSQNHIYFPPRLAPLLGNAKYILLTEGEKKAAACVKAGIPCIGLSGVDSWRSRILKLPKETNIATLPSGQISVKLPSGGKLNDSVDTIAIGLTDIIKLVKTKNIPIIICYDNDTATGGIKDEVARAAATLGFELRHRGLPIRNIRHMVLPSAAGNKCGLDDFLVLRGVEALEAAIAENLAKPSAFPRHPNIKEYVNNRLQKTHMPRSDQIAISMAILSDLDARGSRLRAPTEGALYYFSKETKTLTPVEFSNRPDFAETPFGRMLYQEYNLGINDQRALGWLITQFSAEEPIAEVHPEKVMAWRGDTLYYQINDGCMAKISKDGVSLLDNGTDNVLFESDHVENIPTNIFGQALKSAQVRPEQNWWLKVLKQTRVKDEAGCHRKLLSYLYYISPFFYRWRGTQLPIEITTGEPGSGKSTLFELRLSILTGIPKLRNAPNDLKDWNSTLATTGALHVTDNVQMTDGPLRQRLSDEMCRIVTEPKPTIEMRKLYTTADVFKIPVRCVFGVTAIKQPFTNIDIMQRSIMTELDKGISADLTYDAEWKEHQLQAHGGRAQWLAHQLVFVQRLLRDMEKNWKMRYQARFRLINLEQLLQMAAIALGEESEWIPEYLEATRDKKIADNDWALKGLKAFVETQIELHPTSVYQRYYPGDEIAAWCSMREDFAGCAILKDTNAIRRYIHPNKHSVATVAKIMFDEPSNMFRIIDAEHPPEDTD